MEQLETVHFLWKWKCILKRHNACKYTLTRCPRTWQTDARGYLVCHILAFRTTNKVAVFDNWIETYSDCLTFYTTSVALSVKHCHGWVYIGLAESISFRCRRLPLAFIWHAEGCDKASVFDALGMRTGCLWCCCEFYHRLKSQKFP